MQKSIEQIMQLTDRDLRQLDDSQLWEMNAFVKTHIKDAIKNNNLDLVKVLNSTVSLIQDCMGYETVTLELKVKNFHNAMDFILQSEYRVPAEEPFRSISMVNAKQNMLSRHVEVVEVVEVA